MKNKIGILLTNIGTPDAPTPVAVRQYLKQFLSDPRVIELSPLLWKPLLYSVILPFRPKRSAELYKKIWTAEGSPLLTNTLELAIELENALRKQLAAEIFVNVGMRYGNPSIHSALCELNAKMVERIFVLPLFPQYSATTTASAFDAVAQVFKTWRKIPEIRMLNDYATDPSYIEAVAKSIREFWLVHEKKYLLFSFHGIPQRYIDAGDPYASQCEDTAKAIAENLMLTTEQWSLAYQSRLGPTQWLQPYTDKVLKALPKRNITEIQVVSPGFPIDCLETLEEINIRGKEHFLAAGGKSFAYIPALNSSAHHVEALMEIIKPQIQSWI